MRDQRCDQGQSGPPPPGLCQDRPKRNQQEPASRERGDQRARRHAASGPPCIEGQRGTLDNNGNDDDVDRQRRGKECRHALSRMGR